jgi:hypothetical protein
MPNGNPTATTSSPCLRRCVCPSVAAARSSGIVFAFTTARSFSGCTPCTDASDSSPSKKVTVIFSLPCTTCRLVRMKPWSTITTPEPVRAFDQLAAPVVDVAAHAHDRGQHRAGGLGRAGGQTLVLERVQHGGVDVVLREVLPCRPRRVVSQQQSRGRRARPRRRARTARGAAGTPRPGLRRAGRRRGGAGAGGAAERSQAAQRCRRPCAPRATCWRCCRWLLVS